MSISVQNLTKNYGEQRALNNVSFTVNQGEVVGLLGPNGAGKSTLMKILTTSLFQTSGEAFVHGLSTSKDAQKIRQLIGYLPEHNPLYLEMYVREFLLHVANFYLISNKKQRVEEIIELTGLSSEVHKRLGQLSKGYRQRVGLAQALVHDPSVLILDEPTTGLDPNQIIEIRSLIAELGKQKTVLLSTHIMQEVEAVCSRAIIINKGNLVDDLLVKDLQSKNISLEELFHQRTL